MEYTKLKFNDEIEPGDFVVYSSHNALNYGFYKGTGKHTIQIVPAKWILFSHQHNRKFNIISIFGKNKNYRVMKSHPDLITSPEERLIIDEAIKIIKKTNILPDKY